MKSLFDPIRAGELELANRIVMAPLTRNRAIADNVPGPLTVEYYRQRASAGLIISEATPISPMAHGYIDTPGIHTSAQIAGWRKVTDAVHADGGKIVAQLWHVGRVSHTSLLPEGAAPVGPSDRVAENTNTFTRDGFVPVSRPRALRDDELPGIVADYRRAASLSIEAGFDGIEVHCANNYLLEQFLRDSVNDRSGAYGGSIANRARLVVEVMQAICDEIGAGRTGIRLSPLTTGNGAARDSDPQALYNHLVEQLAPMGLAFVHVVEGETGGVREPMDLEHPFDFEQLHERFPGAWMVNNGYTRTLAIEAVENGRADLVAFGRAFIGNPDLVRRLREDATLNVLRADKLYGGGAEGYTDYPTLDAAKAS